MSIKNLFNEDNVGNPAYTLYASEIVTDELEVNVINHVGNDAITADDLTVTGDLVAAGNNYSTPDLGLPNYSLHTDGAGNTFWAPDDTGSGDVGYNGVAPTVAGQLSRFSGVDGLTIDQSAISDDGANLDLNNQNITNVNLVDGVDLAAFKSDYDSKVNQDVRSLASPAFTNLQAQEHIIYDPVDMTNRYNIQSNAGQLQLYNDTGNVQMRVNNNASVEITNNLEVNGNTTLKGAVTYNTVGDTYTLPVNRGAAGTTLKMLDGLGTVGWGESISYCLSFGGVLNSLPKLAIVNGDPDNVTTNTIDSKTECKVPYSASLRRVSWTTASGGATQIQILQNAISIYSFNLNATSGVQPVVGVSFTEGDNLSVRLLGANAGAGTVHCLFA